MRLLQLANARLILSSFAVVGLFSARAPAAEETSNVPYVGCASDGQQGPQPPPKHSRPTPRLPISVASRLAYYGAVDNGVLAPRGWHCFSLYGSDGASVFVTPDPIAGRRLIGDPDFRFKGEVVEFSYTLGGTSGRFEVADVSSSLFPIASNFVKRIAKEKKEFGIPLAQRSFPKDRILTRTDTVVRFETPPNQNGLGTSERLRPNGLRVQGMAVLLNKQPSFPDLIKLNIRLDPKDSDLVGPIQSVVESNHGDSLSDTPLQSSGG